jgi:hypothetical protein
VPGPDQLPTFSGPKTGTPEEGVDDTFILVPLPHLGGHDGIEFDRRRLTLSYDNPQPTALSSLTVTGRFLGVAGSQINVTITAGECQVLDVPRDACAAAFHVDQPPAGNVRGPLSALVEYSD